MDTKVVTEARPLRVMQWNTLADGLAQFGDFHWREAGSLVPVDADVLDWGKRGPKLLQEILKADADLVCLQEVNHFGDYFLPQLRQHGYDGTFEPKTYSPAQRYGFPPDGCAIFYRTPRLQLRMKNDAQKQGAIVCRFQDLQADGREFIVATKHFKAKTGKENDAKRLSQAQSLTRILMAHTQRNNNLLPCIVCADLNAVPGSEVHDFMDRHELRLKSVYACGISSKGEEDLHTRDNDGADEETEEETPHVKVDWTSCGGAGSEPSWTSWKYRSVGLKMETNDYIWISKDTALCPSEIRALPSAESLGSKGLPSESMPSDHVPLLCQLVWK